jgi:hypothetical protein
MRAGQRPPPNRYKIIMKNLTPRHIQEAESDRRSIKEGWYATNKTGQVCSSRFSNREDCQAHIEQEATRYCGHAVGDNGYRRRAEEMWRSAIG